jgi:hypothetical protein
MQESQETQESQVSRKIMVDKKGANDTLCVVAISLTWSGF